ncbi:MAG: methyltransferase [Candidatus Xenobia bacterium]
MQETLHPTPERVFGQAMSHIANRTLNAALELQLFTHIERGSDRLETLCQAAGTSMRGTRILLDALVGLGYVERKDGKLSLPPDVKMFLSEDSQAYLGAVLRHSDLVWNHWSQLAEAVRRGHTPVTGVETTADDGSFFAKWVHGLFNMNYPAAQAVAKQLGQGVTDVLDIGAGSGVWSIAFATANPQVRITGVDRDVVLEQVMKPFTERLGCAARATFKKGDFRTVDLGHSAYDVALLGHILHSEGWEHSRTLLARIFKALRPGGRLVVAEFVTDDEHSTAVTPLLFGVNMLMLTEHGDVFSARELEGLMREAGFARTEWLQVPAPSPLLVAHKA